MIEYLLSVSIIPSVLLYIHYCFTVLRFLRPTSLVSYVACFWFPILVGFQTWEHRVSSRGIPLWMQSAAPSVLVLLVCTVNSMSDTCHVVSCHHMRLRGTYFVFCYPVLHLRTVVLCLLLYRRLPARLPVSPTLSQRGKR